MVPVPSCRRIAAVLLGLAVVAALSLPGAAAASAGSAGSAGSATAADGPLLSYLVNTKAGPAAARRAEEAVRNAGGTVVVTYQQIGVVVAHSANPDFAAQLREVRGIDSAGASRTAPLRAAATTEEGRPVPVDAKSAEALAAGPADPDDEPLEPLQWDLRAIKADQAHQTTLGGRDVLVGIIDTGIDDTHPDLTANFDRDASVNCAGGSPDTTQGAWRPTLTAPGSYHGTHVAGTIAAPRNHVGVSGVAPGVRISAIRVSEPDTSLFFPESVVCGLVWAAEHHVDITNNSYYVDPWYFNCVDDPDQKAIVDAVGRAARYAERQGTLNVAAAGNSNFDLAADQLADDTSPDDSTPVQRTVDPGTCLDVPTQLPGVVTVAATGSKRAKTFYSNYGLGQIDVSAPGGDRHQVPDPPAVNGGILSTMPGDQYAYLSGTSMASPHVAGVAALLKSTHPWASPAALQGLLRLQADDVACPEKWDWNADGTVDGVCEGVTSYNGFYGHGMVDARAAVKKPW